MANRSADKELSAILSPTFPGTPIATLPPEHSSRLQFLLGRDQGSSWVATAFVSTATVRYHITPRNEAPEKWKDKLFYQYIFTPPFLPEGTHIKHTTKHIALCLPHFTAPQTWGCPPVNKLQSPWKLVGQSRQVPRGHWRRRTAVRQEFHPYLAQEIKAAPNSSPKPKALIRVLLYTAHRVVATATKYLVVHVSHTYMLPYHFWKLWITLIGLPHWTSDAWCSGN